MNTILAGIGGFMVFKKIVDFGIRLSPYMKNYKNICFEKSDKFVLISGSTDGIGKELAK